MTASELMTRIILTATLLPALSPINEAQTGSDASVPLSKQEMISLLKEAEAHRQSQADIVSEVNRRGIAFPVDEKAIKELRQAGARSFLLDAIQRARRNDGKPRISDPQIVSDDAHRRARDETTANESMLEQARRHAIEFAQELPNFIVTQMVSRYVRSPEDKDWQLEDTLELELTYRIDKGEEFKLLRINGKPTVQSYTEVGGSTSTGEFGTTLAALFLPQSQAEFKEIKRETLHGRPTVVYDYKVKKANSNSTISDRSSGKTIVAGYSGTIWIDVESSRALRIEESHEGIPASFPVSLSENSVEYDWITIAGERYLLPVRAEVLLGQDDKRIYSRNIIEFKGYRKFEARIKVDPN